MSPHNDNGDAATPRVAVGYNERAYNKKARTEGMAVGNEQHACEQKHSLHAFAGGHLLLRVCSKEHDSTHAQHTQGPQGQNTNQHSSSTSTRRTKG